MKRALNKQRIASLRVQPQRLAYAVLAASMLLPAIVSAALPAIAPDAGRLTRELQAPVKAPTPGVTVALPSVSRDSVMAGGPAVVLKSVNFTGNTVFTTAQLQAFVQPALGQSLDLAALYNVADQVSAYYRDQGYAFAKVFVPQNGFREGVLTLQVFEGNYGARTAKADSPRRSAQAQRFLKPLKAGTPIYAPDLERQTLILDDQPGYDVMPVIKPGSAIGTGDLEVTLTPTPKVSGNVSVSNHGNRYTGYYQARANVIINSPLMFGDQLTYSVMASDARLNSANVGYSLPLGGSGLRATASYSSTAYRLGREFANLQASGRAQTTAAGVSYPLIRSRTANLTASLQSQHKRFFDEQQSVNARQSRQSKSTVLGLNFDRSDRSGVTYGQVEWANGRFSGPVPDLALTNGRFSRLNADVVRLQRVFDNLSVYARINAQRAGENLDSSESFSIGGPNSVRAYVTGEGTGDEGQLGQFEVRYQASSKLAPFLFYDAGRVRLEHKPTNAGKNRRSLTGAGAGVRYSLGPLNVEGVLARRLTGGEPETDPRDNAITAWLVLSYAF
jgi:hemolysin activation/secretion protein